MIIGLDHVLLAAPPDTEPALRAFYTGVLGLPEIPKPPALAARGGCWFQVGPVQLHLGIDPAHRPSPKAHPAFRVSSLDTLAARLTAHDVHLTWDTALPGHGRFHTTDPAGNRLEFLEPAA
ncbi:VOC family protein [Streptomyces sp. NPDC060194]|uniref:VOC family protein n=1 Tax=Streptomyces sp. NPDC060194 TaxID=3347069 RepID=UPI0036554F51